MYQYIIHVDVAVAGGVGLHFNFDPNPSEQELLGSVDGISWCYGCKHEVGQVASRYGSEVSWRVEVEVDFVNDGSV